jgi:hypothetical protein
MRPATRETSRRDRERDGQKRSVVAGKAPITLLLPRHPLMCCRPSPETPGHTVGHDDLRHRHPFLCWGLLRLVPASRRALRYSDRTAAGVAGSIIVFLTVVAAAEIVCCTPHVWRPGNPFGIQEPSSNSASGFSRPKRCSDSDMILPGSVSLNHWGSAELSIQG